MCLNFIFYFEFFVRSREVSGRTEEELCVHRSVGRATNFFSFKLTFFSHTQFSSSFSLRATKYFYFLITSQATVEKELKFIRVKSEKISKWSNTENDHHRHDRENVV